MATSDQILSLIRNHLCNDDAQFRKVALQISAVESRNGHVVMARTIQDLLKEKNILTRSTRIVLNDDVSDLLLLDDSKFSLDDLVVSRDVRGKIDRVIKEYEKRESLHKYGLDNRRKLMLHGLPGTGKTMTAHVLAKELSLPLFIVRFERIITKFLGETGLRLSKVFDAIREVQGVYLFDEFDAIASKRGMDNEVGEQRRIINTFLQLLERDDSDSFIIASTNTVDTIDNAVFRRFDDVVEYGLPDADQRRRLLMEYLYSAKNLNLDEASVLLDGMSHAEIKMVCSDVFKESLINDLKIDMDLLKSTMALSHRNTKAV